MSPHLPVDAEAISKALGITVQPRPLSYELSGAAFPQANTIVVNSTHITARQRFTCAHELYHILDPQASHRECDQFAAELLMPEEIFRQAYTASGWMSPRRRLSELTVLFGVSAKAFLRRVKEIGAEG